MHIDFFHIKVKDLKEELDQLPKRTLMASGFITYLSQASEGERRGKLSDWINHLNLDSFNLRYHKHWDHTVFCIQP